MEGPDRRTAIAILGSAAVAGTAGCTSVIDFFTDDPPDLNIWVDNNLENEIDYEMTVESVTKSGSLDTNERDVYVDAVDRSSIGRRVTIAFKLGVEEDGEFVPLSELEDTFRIADEDEAAFARFIDGRTLYGLIDKSGED